MIGIPVKRPEFFLIIMSLYGCEIRLYDRLDPKTFLEPGMRLVELHYCMGPAVVAHGIYMGN